VPFAAQSALDRLMKKRCPNANISRFETLKAFFKPLRAFFAKGFFQTAKGFLFKPLRAFFSNR
jgi:hypothetical protein